MSKLIRSPKGRLALLTLLLCGVAISVVLVREAQAAPYVNPFWTNNSPSQESAIEMVAERAIVCESGDATAAGSKLSIDLRTGEVFYDLFLFDTPGVVEDNVFALRWRSMISGSSQLGNGVLPSWETTVEKVIIDAGNPNGNGGHKGVVRWPSGRTSDYLWNGSTYVGPSDVFHTLTTVSGNYRPTDKWGNRIDFDARGTPAAFVDRNANTDTSTYSSAYRMTGYTDDRGKGYRIVREANRALPAGPRLLSPFGTLGCARSPRARHVARLRTRLYRARLPRAGGSGIGAARASVPTTLPEPLGVQGRVQVV